MNTKEWLAEVVAGATTYNQQRLHTNFQEDEILKFLDWLHKQHNVDYVKPDATHQNTPEVKQYLKDIKE
jgi:hypothetical protein